jgi:hypothetical protein
MLSERKKRLGCNLDFCDSLLYSHPSMNKETLSLMPQHHGSEVSTDRPNYYQLLEKYDNLISQRLNLEHQISELKTEIEPLFRENMKRLGIQAEPTSVSTPSYAETHRVDSSDLTEYGSKMSYARKVMTTYLGKEFSRKELELALNKAGRIDVPVDYVIQQLSKRKQIKHIARCKYRVISKEITPVVTSNINSSSNSRKEDAINIMKMLVERGVFENKKDQPIETSLFRKQVESWNKKFNQNLNYKYMIRLLVDNGYICSGDYGIWILLRPV